MKRTEFAALLAGVAAQALWTVPALAQQKPAASVPASGDAAMQIPPAQSSLPEAPAAQGGGLGEIVVTAQKRAESAQSVPISITAVDGAALEQQQAVSLQALQGSVPNLQINNFSNTPNTAVFTIRGIGVIDPDPYAGNTVSIVYDGVPQYFSIGALLDLYDIERVEILRGPQGTLFGANTTGGVVNVVTAQPTGEFGGKVKAGYGNYDRFDIAGTIDIPIVQGLLAGKAVISHHRSDGYHTSIVDGSSMGDRNVTIYRGYLKATPSADFDATLIGEYDRARNGASIFVNGSVPGEALYVQPGPLPGAEFPMYQSPCVPAGQSCDAPNRYFSGNNSVPDRNDMDTYRATLTMNWRNTPLGDLTSVTGYKKFDLIEFTDQDGSALLLADSRRRTDGWQFSQELRSAFDIGNRFNMVAGAFYMKTHYDHRQDYRIQFAAPGLIQINTQDQDNYSISGFAQGYYQLTDTLQLQAGLRFTHEKTSMLARTLTSISPEGLSTFDGDGNIVISDVAPPRASETWNNVGWKIGLDYEPTNDLLLYAYWARGFKSGVFTGRLGLASDLGPADPEEVDTYEAGFKADFLDNRLRVNLAAFYTDYRDIQLATLYFAGSGENTVQGNSILNAAKARIQGFELETTALPFDGFTLTGSLAYLDAEYEEFLFYNATTVNGEPIGFQDLSGEDLQNAPKWTATAGAAYEFDLGVALVNSGVRYSYVASKFLTALNNTPRSKIQPTHLVDANIDFTLENPNVTFGLWATNLLDNRYMASVFDAPGTLGLAAYAPPRRYGVTVKTEW